MNDRQTDRSEEMEKINFASVASVLVSTTVSRKPVEADLQHLFEAQDCLSEGELGLVGGGQAPALDF
jgi:hypothetical protein